MSAYVGVTSAAEVAKAVRSDLKNSRCLTNTDNFVKRILQVADIREDQVEKMFKKLSRTKTKKPMYDSKNRRWKDFPSSKITTEVDLYAPFVQAVNKIQKVAAKVVRRTPVPMLWHDRHTYSPASISPDGPQIKPDILAVLKHRSQDCKDMDKKTADEKNAAEKQGNSKATKDSEEEGIHTWWHSVVFPVEIKPNRMTKGADVKSLVTQLGTYMRQVLREQVDRRFVFGLTLCGTDLRVWLCDRAGLIGTDTSINIHEEPKSFIKVMAALAMLEAHDLGWDTNMRLYSPLQRKPVYSWSPECTKADYPASAYDTKWVIRVHLRDKPEFLITVQVYSIARSEVMRGRATLVWLVMPCDADGKVAKTTDGPYVLKRCWRPADEAPESSFYEKLGSAIPNISQLYGAGDSKITVKVGGEEVVDSTDFIRRVMPGPELHEKSVNSPEQPVCDPTVPTQRETRSSRKRSVDGTPRSEVQEQGLHGETVNIDPSSGPFGSGEYKALVHYDLAMKALGWSIKFFKDLPELLRATRDAIAAHRDCYLSNILHRDISIGNILISPRRGETEKRERKYDAQNTEGKLIDFDHAICATDDKPVTEIEASDKETVRIVVACEYKHGIEESAVNALVSRVAFPTNSGPYVRKIFTYKPDLKQALDISTRPLTCKDLDLYDLPDELKNKRKPVFTPPPGKAFVATGTFPFMSAELLSGTRYASASESDVGVIHDAVHDMESFFWVLVYLCLTRSGPGANRRDELQSPPQQAMPARRREGHKSGDTIPSLNAVVGGFFDNKSKDDLVHNRRLLFDHPQYMETYIIGHFHAYFEDLKGLVREWWRFLRLAYIFSPCPIIHQQFLAAIDATIAKLEGQEKKEAGRDREIKRREEELKIIEDFDPDRDPLRPSTPQEGRTAPGPLDMSPNQPASLGKLPLKHKDTVPVRLAHDVPRDASMPPPPDNPQPRKKARTEEHKVVRGRPVGKPPRGSLRSTGKRTK